MQLLEPPDTFYLSAAVGWVELGNPTEAKAELLKVAPALAGHPAVLEVSWTIHVSTNDWAQALEVAEQLVHSAADHASAWLHRAYAMRRAPGGGLEAARAALLPAVDRFPEEATIPYNLACYACQMGHLDEARRWLQRALAVGKKGKIKSMASADRDLQPLWDELKSL